MRLPSRQVKLLERFQNIRRATILLCEGLNAEDMVVQSMPDCSPTKWHLAHTSWFYEAFIAKPHCPNYRYFNKNYLYLFNSYYESQGERHARPHRGMLTRPPLEDVLNYRRYIDKTITALLQEAQPDTLLDILEIGLHHEMQHQELLLTDILHLFSSNPLFPLIFERRAVSKQTQRVDAQNPQQTAYDGGLIRIGTSAEATSSPEFAYDNETPEHPFWLQPYHLHNHTVTNREWLNFMEDGGYSTALLWLSDGWDYCQKMCWQAPLYWYKRDEEWHQFGLDGLHPLELDAPVCHISFYEAEAFARWAGKRLPTEQEWEWAAASASETRDSPDTNFLESHMWRPQAANKTITTPDYPNGPRNLFGNVWEWTASPYRPYPGYSAQQGALGEYNGKFMANQWVLRGGSCVTSQQQIRTTYRNFFYPHQRWQFSGLRLAY